MSEHTAIVTGGLRGLGHAMALGLLRKGCNVVAVGHIEADIAAMRDLAQGESWAARLHPMVADLRKAAACDTVFAETRARFGEADILVNSAGLTFTYSAPDRFRRKTPQTFWQCGDDVTQNVMDTNFMAADMMARRAVPPMLARGWGRIVNVTTKLDTMNREGSSPYGPSKAALEMASEIWAKELAGTGVTANVVNPGAGANTPGMAQEMRDASAAGTASRLVEPNDMIPPLLFVVSREADAVNGFRFDANVWDTSLPPIKAARRIAQPSGFVLHPPRAWDA